MPGEGQSIENLQIEIGTESSSAYQGLEKLMSVLKRIDNLGNKSTGLSRLRTQLKSISGISLAPLSKELKSIRNSLADIAKLRGVFQSVTGAAGVPAANVPTATPTANTETTSAVNNATQPLRDAASEFNAVSEGASGLDNSAGAAANSVSECTRSLKGVKPAAESGSKALGKFTSSLKRIMLYRAIRYILRKITEALKEGLQNVAQYSSEVNYNLSQLSTVSLQLKNSLGAMLAPAIQAVTPLLMGLAYAGMIVFNSLNAVFSILTGKGTMIQATKYWQDYAKGVDSAKKSLAGFDEINKLGETNSVGAMFETVEIGAGQFFAGLGILLAVVVGVTALVAALKGWNLAKFGSNLKTVGAILMIVLGTIMTISGYIDIWNNGATWENVLITLGGMVLIVGGLALKFGAVGAEIGLVIAAIALVIAGIKDMCENGIDIENVTLIVAGLTAAVVALGLKFGSVGASIGLILANITTLILGVVKYFQSWGEMSLWQKIAAGFLLAASAAAAIWAIIEAIKGNYVMAGIAAGIGVAVAVGGVAVIDCFANGGLPTEGQLFIANEAGPELVGNIGHRTAVANDNQIVSGIAQGVSEGMEDMAYGGDWIIQIVDSDGRIKGSQIVRAADRKNKRDGKTVVQLG